MSSYFPTTFLSAGALEVALLFFVGGIIILLRSLHTQDRQIGEQKLVIVQLAKQLQDCIAHQVTAQEAVNGLHEQCMSLNARQQLIEKHGSDVQRIDLAMRMLKRGVGSAETLHDLGLNSSEIKLLLRLHSNPKAKHEEPPVLRKTARTAVPVNIKPAVVQRTEPVEVVGDSTPSVSELTPEPVPEQVPEHVSEQGQELAKLFKARAAS